MATLTRDPMTPTNSLPWLLRLYPATWRARYGAELADLMAARPPSPRDRLDVVLGALDAHLRPQLADSPDPQRAPTSTDRVLALGAVVAGALFMVWGGAIAVAAPRWNSTVTIDPGLIDLSYGAGFIGVVIAIGLHVGIAVRHTHDLGPLGTLGALAAATGLLFAFGGAGMLAVLLIAGGTLAMAPALAGRIAPAIVGIVFTVGTLVLVAGMFGFMGSNGQETVFLWLLLAYGPGWIGLGFSLRRGPRVRPVTRPATIAA